MQSNTGKPRRYLTSKEAAEFLGRTPKAIVSLVYRRQIPYRKPGGRLLFLREELEQWIENAPGVRPEEIEFD